MRTHFTRRELEIIKRCDAPEKVQAFLVDEIEYNWEKDGIKTLRSFRRVIRDRVAHCIEGALTATAILSQHGYPPKILCMEARDIDHNVFVFKRGNKIGSVAKSRDNNLLGREPKYKTYRGLVMSYYPFYYNEFTKDKNDLTLRGYAIVDLGKIKQDWITAEEDLWFIEELLYKIKYRALFPIHGKKFYYSPSQDGNIILVDE